MDIDCFTAADDVRISVARKMSVAENFIVVCLLRVSRSFWHLVYNDGASAKLDASLDIFAFAVTHSGFIDSHHCCFVQGTCH